MTNITGFIWHYNATVLEVRAMAVIAAVAIMVSHLDCSIGLN